MARVDPIAHQGGHHDTEMARRPHSSAIVAALFALPNGFGKHADNDRDWWQAETGHGPSINAIAKTLLII